MQEEYRKLSLWMTYSVSKNSKSLEEKVIVIRENLRSKVLNPPFNTFECTFKAFEHTFNTFERIFSLMIKTC